MLDIVKLATFVRCARSALNMSQSELAILSKCSRPTINRIETADKQISPRLDTIENILNTLSDHGVTCDFDNDKLIIKFEEYHDDSCTQIENFLEW